MKPENKRKWARWLLPWVVEVVTRLRYRRGLSLLIDRLTVIAEEQRGAAD